MTIMYYIKENIYVYFPLYFWQQFFWKSMKNPYGNFKYSSSDLILPNLIKNSKQTVTYFHTIFVLVVY